MQNTELTKLEKTVELKAKEQAGSSQPVLDRLREEFLLSKLQPLHYCLSRVEMDSLECLH